VIRRTALAAAALAVVLATAGCGSADPGITAAASTSLQHEVGEVARLAAAHQYEEARRSLTALQADLRRRVASGAVTAARAERIRDAIAAVAADLRAAAPAPAPTPTATPSPTPTPTRAIVTPAPEATKTPAPTVPTDGKKGRGKKGKGGKGKGG